jgi:branched-chain amino acid transport system permease protein
MTTFFQHAIDVASTGSLYALLALGIALIFGIMRLINFAHGDLIVFSAYTLFLLSGTVPWALIVAAALFVAVALALAMDRVAFRPVRGANPATLLVTSFAVSVFLHNLVLITVGARPRGVGLPAFLDEHFTVGGVQIAKLDLIQIVITIILLLGLAAFLRKTSLGVQMRAAAEDFEVARLLGVRANRVIAAAFALSGLLAGVASILLVGTTGSVQPTMGVTPVLIAFIATVMGGMGSLIGAVIGGFVLGTLTVLLQIELPLSLRGYRDAFAFTIVLLILLARPQGLIVPETEQSRV